MKKNLIFIGMSLLLLVLIIGFIKYRLDIRLKEKTEKDEIEEFTSKPYTEKVFFKNKIPEKIYHLDESHVVYQFPKDREYREKIENNMLKSIGEGTPKVLRKYTFQTELERTTQFDERKREVTVDYEKLDVNIYSLDGEKPQLKETIDILKLIEESNIEINQIVLKSITISFDTYVGKEAVIIWMEDNPTLYYLVDEKKTLLIEGKQEEDNNKETINSRNIFDIFTDTNFNEIDLDNRLVGYYLGYPDALTYTLSSENNKNIALFKKYPDLLEYLKNDNVKTELYIYNPDPNKIEDYLKDSVVEGKDPYSGMILGERQSVDQKEHIITSSEEFKKWYKPFDFSKE